MSANIEQVEFAVLVNGEGQDWFDDKDAAIAAAKALKIAGVQVQEIVTYCADRDIIWPLDDEDED